MPQLLEPLAAAVGSGPIASGDPVRAGLGIAGFVALVVVTEVCFMYRMRLALLLGEAVVFDLRQQIFARIMRLPQSYFDKVPLGRLISRLTSDVDVVRTGIQDVVFVSTVQVGSMLVAAPLTALGAALLAGLRAGVWPDVESLRRLPQDTKAFEPRWPEGKRQQRLREWRRAVRAVVEYYTGV